MKVNRKKDKKARFGEEKKEVRVRRHPTLPIRRFGRSRNKRHIILRFVGVALLMVLTAVTSPAATAATATTVSTEAAVATVVAPSAPVASLSVSTATVTSLDRLETIVRVGGNGRSLSTSR